MPAGWSMRQYVALCFISVSSMLLGGSITHNYYKPDLTLPENPHKPESLLKRRTVAIVSPRGAREQEQVGEAADSPSKQQEQQ
eukprot:m.68628 g.68628  ORF g.68628 m.68628 type:complete len:83 (-) comp13689_c0_seq3:62-310(-)